MTPPRGVLLHGPSGCGKTKLAQAIAGETGRNYFAVKGPQVFLLILILIPLSLLFFDLILSIPSVEPQLLSKWVGESERAVKNLFESASLNAPSVIFFV